MMDGRFDQHFLEVFASSHDPLDQEVPWLPITVSFLSMLAFGIGVFLTA